MRSAVHKSGLGEFVPGEIIDHQGSSRMMRWLVKVKSKRGLALRDVFILAKDEHSARDRVQQMYLLSDISTICPSASELKPSLSSISKD